MDTHRHFDPIRNLKNIQYGRLTYLEIKTVERTFNGKKYNIIKAINMLYTVIAEGKESL